MGNKVSSNVGGGKNFMNNDKMYIQGANAATNSTFQGGFQNNTSKADPFEDIFQQKPILTASAQNSNIGTDFFGGFNQQNQQN